MTLTTKPNPQPTKDDEEKDLKRFSYREITDLSGSSVYLRRWSLILLFGWTVKLHEILRPDDDRCEHDHPWWFLRIILKGGYHELENGKPRHLKPWRPWAPWRIYYCSGAFRHRITRLVGSSSWSLILTGPRRQTWGFYTQHGWVQWTEFVKAALTARVAWCDDGRKVHLE